MFNFVFLEIGVTVWSTVGFELGMRVMWWPIWQGWGSCDSELKMLKKNEEERNEFRGLGVLELDRVVGLGLVLLFRCEIIHVWNGYGLYVSLVGSKLRWVGPFGRHGGWRFGLDMWRISWGLCSTLAWAQWAEAIKRPEQHQFHKGGEHRNLPHISLIKLIEVYQHKNNCNRCLHCYQPWPWGWWKELRELYEPCDTIFDKIAGVAFVN